MVGTVFERNRRLHPRQMFRVQNVGGIVLCARVETDSLTQPPASLTTQLFGSTDSESVEFSSDDAERKALNLLRQIEWLCL